MSGGVREFVLVPHPTASMPTDAASIVARWRREGDAFELEYEIVSREPVVLQPCGVPRGRRDGLWHHTCCEWFIADAASGSSRVHDGPYLEFNFSPTGEWAAYAFDAPRVGMRDFLWDAGVPEPEVRHEMSVADVDRAAQRCRVTARLAMPLSMPRAYVRPTVVLETTLGISYWAATHPLTHPDFHHPLGFVGPIEVP